MKRLYVDVTSSTVLIKCRECEYWYALRFTRKEAWEAGRDHEERCHPGATQATTMLSYHRRVAHS